MSVIPPTKSAKRSSLLYSLSKGVVLLDQVTFSGPIDASEFLPGLSDSRIDDLSGTEKIMQSKQKAPGQTGEQREDCAQAHEMVVLLTLI
ncbi:hypothetical protein PtA15_14A90 [Puccinia triticina]|uniref:Uncharacterized protein n=1 Tax=Puccinia triticina TaxID=208348 RepID=A0ABY7D318_9BASI|nr:uncharacterized protein PtA15_14A90 [Puccinia triticina]WAQ91209.1 hypothetical protein PtA15_14A90 [Puccinia triticina]